MRNIRFHLISNLNFVPDGIEPNGKFDSNQSLFYRNLSCFTPVHGKWLFKQIQFLLHLAKLEQKIASRMQYMMLQSFQLPMHPYVDLFDDLRH